MDRMMIILALIGFVLALAALGGVVIVWAVSQPEKDKPIFKERW